MCNCNNSGGVGAIPRSTLPDLVYRPGASITDPNDPCEYTNEMLMDYYDKLVWFKNKQAYKKYNVSGTTLNEYLGIVLTSMNKNNKCTYQSTLDKVKDLADFILTIQNA